MTPAAFRVDGEVVPRARFYAVACDPRQSVVVEACAGSGKTWMLVSRIVRLLLDGTPPHEILAITFTRAAAGEMRDRLSAWLREWALGSSEPQRVAALRERGLGEADTVRLEPRLRELHGRLLEGGRPVGIMTFHAWFAQLLRLAPLESLESLGLQPEMNLIEDDTDLRAPVFRALHRAVLGDAALRDDFSALVATRGRAMLQQWLERAWQRRIEIGQADAAGTLEGSVESALTVWPELAAFDEAAAQVDALPARADLRALAGALATSGRKAAGDAAAGIEAALACASPRQRLDALQSALFTKARDAQPRKLSAAGFDDACAWLARVREQVAQEDAHREHARMTRLARALLRAHAETKREQGIADMADLERLALAVLRDGDFAGWMQEKLDLRVRHVLIDEFQDTSPLQWQTLHGWLSGYAGAGGGTSGQRPPSVFIVGDPKQSLYRFRGAEPRVFAAAADFVGEALAGRRLACEHTRRNAPVVVEAVNRVFAAAGAEGEFEGFRPHTTEVEASAGDGVHRLPAIARVVKGRAGLLPTTLAEWRDTLTTPRLVPDEVLREHEAALAADVLRRLLDAGAAAPAETLLLARKRESLRLVALALRRRGVVHGPVGEATLMDAAEAQDLVALLDVLASPQHGLSLARVLKSPLMGASDDDLVALAEAAREPAGWWAALQSLPAPSPALARARDLLRGWAEAARALPPHDLLGRIVDEGELDARVAAVLPPEERRSGLDAIDAVLAQALLLDSGRYATPYAFVRALRQRSVKAALPVPEAAPRLLTVHGAKGLEADTVFLLDADPEKPGNELTTVLVDWPVEQAAPRRCAFVYNEAQMPASLRVTFRREEAARRREALNLLYVAMTRARHRLVFTATEAYQRAPGIGWWQRLTAALPDEVGPLPASADAPRDRDGLAAAGGPPPAIVRRLPVWRRDERPADAPAAASGHYRPAGRRAASALDDARAASIGRAAHRALEWWGSGPQARDVERAIRLARAAADEFGAPPGPVVDTVRAAVTRPEAAAFFAAERIAWSGNEVSFVDAAGPLRIDRLVRWRDGTWWVIDYKLRHAPEDLEPYRLQLARYRAAVLAAEPGGTVRCAFIAGDGRVVEVVPPPVGAALPAGARPACGAE